MRRRKKTDHVAEYGDFQTPLPLARRACELLARCNVNPATIVEPTCGIGNFLIAALEQFPGASRIIGLDVNALHMETLRSRLGERSEATKVQTIEDSFFDVDWGALLGDLPDPLLVIGNPPWVTNTELGTLGSSNLPKKTNFKNHTGFEALTGKSNFDISEWMLLQFLEWLDGRNAAMAMLCKTVVARKVLRHAWKRDVHLSHSALYSIDANASFGAAVDACFLLCEFSSWANHEATVYPSIVAKEPANVLGYREGNLVADITRYEQWEHLNGKTEAYRWRSGIKHDCAKVMELRKEGQLYRNGFQELVDLEDDYVYPMLKGSEISNGRTKCPKRYMLVTQQSIGEDTLVIKERAPKTWRYLQLHADVLDRRKSSIYRKRPQFSVFGVGDYSFSPWKVAIPGFYKKLDFVAIGNFAGKPIVLDDTCCFVPCATEGESRYIGSILNSTIAQEFLSAFVFWDAKRPITIDLLSKLDLAALAQELGSRGTIEKYIAERADRELCPSLSAPRQLGLFDES